MAKTKKEVVVKEITIQQVEKEINPVVSLAKALVIKTEKDLESSAELLSRLNIAKDKATDQMETITKPAKEGIKAAEAIWKPKITIAKEAIELIRNKQSDYQSEKVAAVRAEEAKIAARIGEGKGHIKLETAVQKLDEIERPATKIVTESGKLNFREDPQFEVMDVTMLPHEYVLANEVKIRAAMKAGIKLTGVRYFTKQVPINNR